MCCLVQAWTSGSYVGLCKVLAGWWFLTGLAVSHLRHPDLLQATDRDKQMSHIAASEGTAHNRGLWQLH